MLNTDSVRMCANMPPGIFGSSRRETHDNHQTSDYFASSVDFEYDLFLRGIVSCDSSTAVVYRSGTTSATTNRKSINSGFLSRVTQRSSQRKKNQNSSSLFSSVTSLNRVAFDPFVPRPPRADSYDNFDSSQSMRFCDLNFELREDDEEFGFKKSSSVYQNLPTFQHHQNRKSLQTTVIEEELESPSSGQNLSYQQQHALHRFRRQKKKGIISKLRDAVISFTPKRRPSIIGRSDLYFRYGKAERESLGCFDFLEEELKNYSNITVYCEENHDYGLVDFELANESVCCDTNQSIPEFPTLAEIVIQQQSQEYAEENISNNSSSEYLKQQKYKKLLTNVQSNDKNTKNEISQIDDMIVSQLSSDYVDESFPQKQANNQAATATTGITNQQQPVSIVSHPNRLSSSSSKQKKKSKQKCKNKYRK